MVRRLERALLSERLEIKPVLVFGFSILLNMINVDYAREFMVGPIHKAKDDIVVVILTELHSNYDTEVRMLENDDDLKPAKEIYSSI